MELRHLRYFVAVAEEGSVTVAAETRLHTAQPSLSRQLRQLEAEVGAPLLVRGARGVTLTPAGRAFLPHARSALEAVSRGVDAARYATRPAKATFSIGFLTGQEVDWLPRVTCVLRDDLPALDVRIASRYSPDLADDLQRGDLDAAILRIEPRPDVAYRVVATERLVVVMPRDHDLAGLDAVDPKVLRGETFIGFSDVPGVLRRVVETYLAGRDIDLAPAHRIDNFAMAVSLVASTHGVAILPTYIVPLLPSSVVSRPLAGVAPTIDIALGYRADNRSPLVRKLVADLGREDAGNSARDETSS